MNNRCKVDKMINIDLLQMTVYNELQNIHLGEHYGN